MMAKDKNKPSEATPVGSPVEPVPVPVEPVPVPVEPVKPPTVAELWEKVEAAIAGKDTKAVIALSRQYDAAVKAEEKAVLEAKRAELSKLAEVVKSAIMEVLEPMIEAGELDAADGVFFTYDFGDKAPTLRLEKTAAKAKSDGTPRASTGKKFDVSTVDLLAKYGTQAFKEGEAKTFQEAWDESTDKNSRFKVRERLLKLEGLI